MSRVTQQELVLARLKRGPATSWELQQLGICSHTSRISELRKKHVITKSEKFDKGRRIVTYALEGHSAPENAPDSEQQRTPAPLACTECGQGVVRKPRAKPLKQGEFPFCSDAHRARYHRREGATT